MEECKSYFSLPSFETNFDTKGAISNAELDNQLKEIVKTFNFSILYCFNLSIENVNIILDNFGGFYFKFYRITLH
jgi:hypothetical protein